MPLHFLCTQRLQPPQKIALELPTPDWQTPQGYFPDFFRTSRLIPDSIIFVFPMFTRRPFFSISVFHVCTFTSSSSMDSALIIRSSASQRQYLMVQLLCQMPFCWWPLWSSPRWLARLGLQLGFPLTGLLDSKGTQRWEDAHNALSKLLSLLPHLARVGLHRS